MSNMIPALKFIEKEAKESMKILTPLNLLFDISYFSIAREKHHRQGIL